MNDVTNPKYLHLYIWDANDPVTSWKGCEPKPSGYNDCPPSSGSLVTISDPNVRFFYTFFTDTGQVKGPISIEGDKEVPIPLKVITDAQTYTPEMFNILINEIEQTSGRNRLSLVAFRNNKIPVAKPENNGSLKFKVIFEDDSTNKGQVLCIPQNSTKSDNYRYKLSVFASLTAKTQSGVQPAIYVIPCDPELDHED